MHDSDVCGTQQVVPVLEVGLHGGVANSVVSLEGVGEGRPLETEPVELEFRDCRLTPHVVAVPMGGTLTVINGEDMLHNIHGGPVSGVPWLDRGLPLRGSRATVSLDYAGIATLVDDAGHPWIRAFVHVFEHPYYQVTSEDGRFWIDGIPPGQYVIRLWHEGMRSVPDGGSGRPDFSASIVFARPVVLMSGISTVVDFQLDLDAVDAAGE